ncbi:MAG: translation elongation factor 4 [Dehalococcoidia bacterium]|nr:translation elongation factor 4 [Dehalococcoidia bacterium]
MITPGHIRNFVIIAHIDHGKSTLADRFLELTGTVEARKMRAQYLDQMDLEREKGITIKMQPVRMNYKCSISNAEYSVWGQHSALSNSEQHVVLNLIDTPGHADFGYEVSRALAAVEGAILLVDATQGVQAQTIANLHLARAQGLVIIPVVNKIDLPGARVAETRDELAAVVGSPRELIVDVSGKTGDGVAELLRVLVERVPPPRTGSGPPQALIFDSQFDPYRGVIAHVRVFGGAFRAGEAIRTIATDQHMLPLEVGHFAPGLAPAAILSDGEIGYVATGLKEPNAIRVGDTLTAGEGAPDPLPGYREPQPAVFASVYPEDADEYERLRDALAKMKLSDAAITFEPESSDALGRGFRMGFLGMLHLDISGERLRREYGLRLIFASPSVAYRIRGTDGREAVVPAAGRMPPAERITEIAEPWVRLEVITPSSTLGPVMGLLEGTRGRYGSQAYLGRERLAITYEVPLRDILVEFSDSLKRVTAGYGSSSYELIGYRPGDLVRLDVLVAGEPEEALAQIVPRDDAYRVGRRIVAKLKELLPRELFAVSLQAAVGGRVLARETLPAMKKDVTGYLYGGDRTRKMKLWSKQQRGKERMKKTGRVDIPPAVFREFLKSGG